MCKLVIALLIFLPLQVQSVVANTANAYQNADHSAEHSIDVPVTASHTHRIAEPVLIQHSVSLAENDSEHHSDIDCTDSCSQCVGCVVSVYTFSVDFTASRNFEFSPSRYLIDPQANYRPPCLALSA